MMVSKLQRAMRRVKAARSLPVIGLALAGLLLVALYSPVFIWLGRVWLDDPHYSHGFLVLPVAAFVAWTRRKELVRTRPNPAGVIVVAGGLAVYVAGFAFGIDWLWALSLLPVVLGLLLYLMGTGAARSMAFPICFLVFMIPFPFIEALTIPLQSVSASGSASIVQAVGIPATRIGAEIRLPAAAFTIGTPCSGMNTLISLLALAALLSYSLKAPFYRKAGLFLLAFPIAILANILRIVLLLMVAHSWGADAGMTFFHDFSNLFVFVFATALLVLLARTFRRKSRMLMGPAHG